MKNLFSVQVRKRQSGQSVSTRDAIRIMELWFEFCLFFCFFRLPSKFRAKLEVTLAVGFKKFK